MKAKTFRLIFGLPAILLVVVWTNVGCGQSGQQLNQDNNQTTKSEINQSLDIIGYDEISVEATDSLTLGKIPSNLKFKLNSSQLSNSVKTSISINFSGFAPINIGGDGIFSVAGALLSSGVNKIAVESRYLDERINTSYATVEVNFSFGNLFWGLNVGPYYQSTINKNPCKIIGTYRYVASSGRSLEKIRSFKVNDEEYIDTKNFSFIERLDQNVVREISFECIATFITEGTQSISMETEDIYYRKSSASWYYYYDRTPPAITFEGVSMKGEYLGIKYWTGDNHSQFLHDLKYYIKDINGTIKANLGTSESQAVGNQYIKWNYKDTTGSYVSNGNYIFSLSCADHAGNYATLEANIEVDR